MSSCLNSFFFKYTQGQHTLLGTLWPSGKLSFFCIPCHHVVDLLSWFTTLVQTQISVQHWNVSMTSVTEESKFLCHMYVAH